MLTYLNSHLNSLKTNLFSNHCHDSTKQHYNSSNPSERFSKQFHKWRLSFICDFSDSTTLEVAGQAISEEIGSWW